MSIATSSPGEASLSAPCPSVPSYNQRGVLLQAGVSPRAMAIHGAAAAVFLMLALRPMPEPMAGPRPIRRGNASPGFLDWPLDGGVTPDAAAPPAGARARQPVWIVPVCTPSVMAPEKPDATLPCSVRRSSVWLR